MLGLCYLFVRSLLGLKRSKIPSKSSYTVAFDNSMLGLAKIGKSCYYFIAELSHILYSHYGNEKFPLWEQNIPIVGI